MPTITESDGTVTRRNPKMSLAESGKPVRGAWEAKITLIADVPGQLNKKASRLCGHHDDSPIDYGTLEVISGVILTYVKLSSAGSAHPAK